MEPKISLVMSAIRPQYWERLWKSCEGNKYPIEIIFVGDVKPIFKLPSNVKYIYATVKPAQCYEIGFREAQGELIQWTADDVTYNHINPNNLDILYDYQKSFGDKRVIASPRAIEDHRDVTKNHRFFGKQNWTPEMAPFALLSRELFHELGGYDIDFIAGQSENDIIMRVLEIGGRVELCTNSFMWVDHVNSHDWQHTIKKGFRHHYPQDRERLENCWVIEGYGHYNIHKKGTISKKRLLPVKSYENKDNICFESQGKTGLWK